MLVDKKKRMIRACLVPIFENMKNTILVFFENCSCYLNLVFSVFFKTKKTWELNVFFMFSLIFLCLRTENSFQKHEPNMFLIFDFLQLE